jgi:predicted DNA-binding transcriptional regulator YafY
MTEAITTTAKPTQTARSAGRMEAAGTRGTACSWVRVVVVIAATIAPITVDSCPRFDPSPDYCGHDLSALRRILDVTMVQTSARLLALLSLLQMRREWTGQELADRLEVGPRTIRRDVEKLRSLGYPVEAAPGVAGGYRLGAGGELPPLLLDDAEAVAVAVGLRTAASGSIEGIEETSIRALAKLEQVLPSRLRRRVKALGDATSAFPQDGPRVDADVLATIAGACRDAVRLRFAYVAKDDRPSQRNTEPSAMVHSGSRWYLVAFDVDREDWRTFRIDRIRGRVYTGERGRRRAVPGGDPAEFVKQQLRRSGDTADAVPGQIRVAAPAEALKGRIPALYAEVAPDGEDASVVTTRGAWSRQFLVWMAMLEEPIEVIGPPEFVDAARTLVQRLGAAV